MKYTTILLLILFAMAVCNKPQKPKFKTVKNLKVVSATPINVTVEGTAVLKNPNDYSVKVQDADIDVSANDIPVSNVKQTLGTEIPANSEFEFPLRVKFNPRKIFNTDNIADAVNVLKGKKVNMKFDGYVTVKLAGQDAQIPLDFKKEISLKKKKE